MRIETMAEMKRVWAEMQTSQMFMLRLPCQLVFGDDWVLCGLKVGDL